MRFPHLIILDPDGEIQRLLVDLAGEHRWLVRTPRTSDSALSFAKERRPGVLFVRVEPGDEKDTAFALIADAHRLCPDVPVVAASGAKLPDADRVAWSAVLMDLGARYVLFPPLSRPVLEDVTSGLMASSVRRVVGGDAPPPLPPARPAAEKVIDLADEDLEG
ncbi:MAG TPA: hypothetical protein VMZ71_15790 [Gemmataceae bacterium]|nr:hypothetical protein [Gemmataceae bacterium]